MTSNIPSSNWKETAPVMVSNMAVGAPVPALGSDNNHEDDNPCTTGIAGRRPPASHQLAPTFDAEADELAQHALMLRFRRGDFGAPPAAVGVQGEWCSSSSSPSHQEGGQVTTGIPLMTLHSIDAEMTTMRMKGGGGGGSIDGGMQHYDANTTAEGVAMMWVRTVGMLRAADSLCDEEDTPQHSSLPVSSSSPLSFRLTYIPSPRDYHYHHQPIIGGTLNDRSKTNTTPTTTAMTMQVDGKMYCQAQRGRIGGITGGRGGDDGDEEEEEKMMMALHGRAIMMIAKVVAPCPLPPTPPPPPSSSASLRTVTAGPTSQHHSSSVFTLHPLIIKVIGDSMLDCQALLGTQQLMLVARQRRLEQQNQNASRRPPGFGSASNYNMTRRMVADPRTAALIRNDLVFMDGKALAMRQLVAGYVGTLGGAAASPSATTTNSASGSGNGRAGTAMMMRSSSSGMKRLRSDGEGEGSSLLHQMFAPLPRCQEVEEDDPEWDASVMVSLLTRAGAGSVGAGSSAAGNHNSVASPNIGGVEYTSDAPITNAMSATVMQQQQQDAEKRKASLKKKFLRL